MNYKLYGFWVLLEFVDIVVFLFSNLPLPSEQKIKTVVSVNQILFQIARFGKVKSLLLS